jgi:16S rRNA (cytidine(1402)-2'-O)-methyltransferase
MYKVNIADPADRILIFSGSCNQIWLSISRDGKKLGGSFPWSNNGGIWDISGGTLLNFGQYGCWASTPPDNSYRFAIYPDDTHHGWQVFNADKSNSRFVALNTSAWINGYPTHNARFAINDPGYELVQAALASGFDVRPVPGPSAPISALTVSGLPTDSFLYLGYLPHKSNERRTRLTEISQQPFTLVFLESPHRLVDSLEDILSILGDRRICVAREMTKMYEEFWRGSVSGAIEYFKSKEPRGEFTLVIGGNKTEDRGRWTEDDLLKAIKKELKADKPTKELSAELAKESGWNKRDVYALINSMK